MAPLAKTDTLRVATLNLWGQHGNWQERRLALVEGFQALRPDVVALQEVITTADYDQAADLLGLDYHAIHQSVGLVAGDHHVAVCSRWPVVHVQEVDQHLAPRTAGFPCTTLLAEIHVLDPVGPVLFVNHFPNYQLDFEHERELQAVAAARAIELRVAQHSMHVVLAGDLDADPAAASIRFWTGRQSLDGMSVCYRDAWESAHPGEPGYTFTPKNPLITARDWPFRRIDYIFVRCGGQGGGPTLCIESCRRIFDEPRNGVWASDHFGVMADLAIPPAH